MRTPSPKLTKTPDPTAWRAKHTVEKKKVVMSLQRHLASKFASVGLATC